MDAVFGLYDTHPFWIWLIFGAALLAVESAFGTEWLLWPAVSAGVVAVLTAVGVRPGFPAELAIFAVLTLASTLASRRLVKRVNPSDVPDINDRDLRLVGASARVTEGFVDGRGRVFVSGAEWPAVIEGASPLVGETVVVEAVSGPRLTVRAV